MNRNILKHILILLLASTAVLSCSPGMVEEIEDLKSQTNPYGYNLLISGSASDKDTSLPIEEIKITLTATEKTADGRTISHKKSAYTDNEGVFTLKINGFRGHVTAVLTAEDPNGNYKSATHEIPLITWDSSYNMSDNDFFINDCSFYLEKK